MKNFKRILTAIIVMSLVLGMMTGCRKGPKNDPVGDVVSTATPVPDQKDDPTPTAAPTEAPTPTETPVDDNNGENENAGGDANTENGDNPDAVPPEIGGYIPKNPELGDDAEYNYIVEEFNGFLRGENKAGCLDRLSDVFKPMSNYNINEIGEGFRIELNSRFMDQRWRLDGIDFALIDAGLDGKPELAVKYTYNNTQVYDSPYEEIMLFVYDYGCMYFEGSVTSYYREFSTINQAGYCMSSGSSGANLSSASFYYLTEYGDFRFMHSEFDIFGVTEPRIPQYYLPSDTKITGYSDGEDYSDHGGFVEMVSLKEDVGDDYNQYLRDCYYTFFDFDGNPISADEAYIAECAADGIRIVSYEELQGIIAEKELECGLTEEVKNTPEVMVWRAAPEGAWELGKGEFGNFKVIADNMDMWLDPVGDNYSCYAVADMDFNGRFELIRAIMDFWTDDTFLSFYEVNDDFTGLIELEYEDQFTVDGEIDGRQPDIVNAEDIREYSGNGGNYYYVIPTSYYFDTLAYSTAVNKNMVLRKTNGENRVTFEGYSGGVDWFTEYDPDDYSKVKSDGATYYRWDDTECTEDEFAKINKAYFATLDTFKDYPPEGYNKFEFCFNPMMVGSEDTWDTCFVELMESFAGWKGAYVYSPDGK